MRTCWPILAILSLLASLLVPGIASARTAVGAETRVWAFDLADQVRTGAERSLTLDLHQGCEPTYDEIASDSLLAKGGLRAVAGLGDELVQGAAKHGDKVAKAVAKNGNEVVEATVKKADNAAEGVTKKSDVLSEEAGDNIAARGGSRGADDLGTIFVDSKGNAIPTPKGGSITGSPDGRFIQARDAAGRPTGVRIDGAHNPATHPDPRAQAPHGHVPGVTNPDGTPWLPIKQ